MRNQKINGEKNLKIFKLMIRLKKIIVKKIISNYELLNMMKNIV